MMSGRVTLIVMLLLLQLMESFVLKYPDFDPHPPFCVLLWDALGGLKGRGREVGGQGLSVSMALFNILSVFF